MMSATDLDQVQHGVGSIQDVAKVQLVGPDSLEGMATGSLR